MFKIKEVVCINDIELWHGDCPECGGGGMCKNNMIVLTSIPPKYEYRCNKCGYVEYLRF